MQEQKIKILNQAGELFMRYGLKSVSMDDVARALGISKKTLYLNFSTKKELIREVMALMSEEDLATIQQSLVESSDAIDEYLRNSRYFINSMRQVSPNTLYDLQKYYPEIWQDGMVNQMQEFTDNIRRNLLRGISEGLFRDDINADIIAKIYVQNMIAICDTSIFPGHEVAVVEIIHQHASYHLHGVVNEKGRRRMAEYLQKDEA